MQPAGPPLSVAVVAGQFPVVSETFVLNQVTGLLRRGHEVDVYALDGKVRGSEPVHEDALQWDVRSRTRYGAATWPGRAARVAQGFGRVLVLRGASPCAWTEPLRMLRVGDRPLATRWLYTAAAIVTRRKYDVIHCQFGPLGRSFAHLRSIGLVAGKLVTSFRGFDVSKTVEAHGDDVYADLFAKGDLFLPNCDFFRRRLVELGCDARRLVVHRSGIDLGRFRRRRGRVRERRRLRCATVGRLVEKKGIEHAIRAVAALASRGVRIEYVVVGDGPLRRPLERLTAELGVADLVRFEGARSQREIIDLLEDVDVFLAPNVTAADGNQDAPVNTLKEAMAMELPVVATRHGGIPELVEDGVSGFLVPERDVGAFAASVELLASRPERWEAMGEAGRARVARDYDLDRLDDQLVEIYRGLVASGDAR